MIKKLTSIVLLSMLSMFVVAQTVPAKKHYGKIKHEIGAKGKKIKMPKFDKKAMLLEDSIRMVNKVGGMRFAKKFKVNLTPENSGEKIIYEDGSSVWKLDVVSDSAYSINLIFSKFHLTDGDTLYIYNEDLSAVLGPLTQENNLKSGVLPLSPVAGSHLIVEFRSSSVDSDKRALEIGSVNHDYRGFKLLPQSNESTYSKDTCSLPVSCVSEIAQVKHSVCLLVLDGAYYCSGTLVNNAAQDGKPYLLTAAHCFDIGTAGVDFSEGEEVAPTIVAFFNYEMPNCDQSIRGSQEFTIGGATMKALAGDIDFALVELSSTPPVDFRPYYAGWNLATSPSSPFRGIHHPYGKVKVTTRDDNNISNTTYPGMLSNSHWKVSNYELGTTQPGSSGSGLFDANLKLVGALTGGSSECATPVDDYFYRLNKSWDYYSEDSLQLKAWLDPASSGVTSLDGYNPYGNDSALRYSNVIGTDTAEIARLQTGSGYIAGHNSLGVSKYAERFCLPENAYLHGVYLVTGKANSSQSTTDTVTVKVYAGSSEPNPSYYLDNEDLLLKTQQWSSSYGLYTSNKSVLSKNENYIKFDAPIAVGDTFFVTYEIPYTSLPADSFTIYTAIDRGMSGTESAYMYYNEQWSKMSDIYGTYTSIWIDPVIIYDPSAEAVDTSLIERSKNTVVFPNPAEDVVYIMTRNDKEGSCVISLYSSFGQKISVTEGKVRYSNIPIDISSLTSGMYLLRVEYSDSVETHKLIVK